MAHSVHSHGAETRPASQSSPMRKTMMVASRNRYPGLATLALLASAACGDGITGVGPPDMFGTVSLVHQQTAGQPRTGLLLENVVAPTWTDPPESALVWLNGFTTVAFACDHDKALLGECGGFEVGVEVAVWITGVELRSLPPQYSATRVEILVPTAG